MAFKIRYVNKAFFPLDVSHFGFCVFVLFKINKKIQKFVRNIRYVNKAFLPLDISHFGFFVFVFVKINKKIQKFLPKYIWLKINALLCDKLKKYQI